MQGQTPAADTSKGKAATSTHSMKKKGKKGAKKAGAKPAAKPAAKDTSKMNP
jgi:hypothetical protein